MRVYKKKIIRSFKKKFFINFYGDLKIADKKKEYFLNLKKKTVNFGEKKNYNVFEISNARVFFDKINDVSFIKQNYLISSISHQIRKFKKKGLKDDSYNNDLIKKNFVLKNGTPKFAKKLKGNVCSLLYTNASKDNYYHWLTDVLPKIGILQKTNLFNKINFFLIHGKHKNFQSESLKLLNIDKRKLIDANKFNHIYAENLITVDHPFMKKNFLLDSKSLPTWISEWYKKKLIKFKQTNKKNILVLRKNSQRRKILNENELTRYLKSKSFKPVYLEDLSFKKQINLFAHANIVIGLNGAGLSNLFFSNRKTKVIEIMFKNSNLAICGISKSSKLKYYNFFLDQTKVNRNKNQDGEGIINIEKFKKKLMKLI